MCTNIYTETSYGLFVQSVQTDALQGSHIFPHIFSVKTQHILMKYGTGEATLKVKKMQFWLVFVQYSLYFT